MTGRRVHHPTWVEYMKLTGEVPTGESARTAEAVALLRRETAKMAALARKHLPDRGGMLADSIDVGYYHDDIDWKRDHAKHHGCLGAACPALPERTSIVRTGEVTWEVTRDPAEPKGPLGLRVRLWWMRHRLWWMRARLDGQPAEALWQSAVPATLGSIAVSVLIDVLDGPSMWWSLPIVFVSTWCLNGGWRTPTVDSAIREAP